MKLAALVEVTGGVQPGRAEPQLNLTMGYTAEELEKDRISEGFKQPKKCIEALLQKAIHEFVERATTEQVRWAAVRVLWLD